MVNAAVVAMLAIVSAFYLLSMFRQKIIRRLYMYWLGFIFGWSVVFVGFVLEVCGLDTAGRILTIIGMFGAFKTALGACWPGRLPVYDQLFPPKQSGQTPSQDVAPGNEGMIGAGNASI